MLGLGPSFKVVPNSQVKLWVSKYVLLGSAIRPLFAEPVTYIVESAISEYLTVLLVVICTKSSRLLINHYDTPPRDQQVIWNFYAIIYI